ncbi:ATP-binding cassette, subfamily B/ATP-binding cassette, subfamily C/ATP-binding cassette, subfamily B, multidrug efflux pump [Brevinema andersonii]|uniref:ATP-binding cassette, subfamily B/ATP-binding cassette, subfamily C/ATP-binding cassette, subfamily B, multidrug efflux pump n=1 Tax=Brevinema andersonii TaxID=34097 RepID=A0A1I1DV76_BREAD|nr:hypothetical protein [Brevinema andersonii]SFB76473.1 ATP-binding cassette, subfamily B/ATP-binding cassette, subfamily C/ATP-binding cassette, subfamily B, multidrug efflux pump [Brevinema andersonii]
MELPAASKIYQVIDMPVEEKQNISCSLGKININLKNINFSYTEDRSILKDINLTIPNGLFISLVGEPAAEDQQLLLLLWDFILIKMGLF